ncbi:MAG: hypothetical protein AAFY38_03815 [Pseudomonadota bacterium]
MGCNDVAAYKGAWRFNVETIVAERDTAVTDGDHDARAIVEIVDRPNFPT